MHHRTPALLATLGLLLAGAVQALTPEDRCDEDKNKIAGKWAMAESKAGPGVCPSEGVEAPVQAFITQHSDDLAVALGGGALSNCSADGPALVRVSTGKRWQPDMATSVACLAGVDGNTTGAPSASNAPNPASAWSVNLCVDYVLASNKAFSKSDVRAVRGGS